MLEVGFLGDPCEFIHVLVAIDNRHAVFEESALIIEVIYDEGCLAWNGTSDLGDSEVEPGTVMFLVFSVLSVVGKPQLYLGILFLFSF
jgi:hypothetical protein